MRKISLSLALVASLFVSEARADFTGKDASAATITFKNPAACSSVVCVPVFQIYDGTNVVSLTTAGADAVSNTLTGVPMYARNMVFNGTTWDRWQGGISIASGKVASGAFASGSIASGAYASGSIGAGAVAAGAYVSGSVLSGAYADGSIVALGALADAKNAATDTTPITAMSVWKQISASIQAAASSLATLVTNSTLAIPTNQSGVAASVIGCDTHAFYDASDNGKKTVVVGVSGKKIYLCGFILATGGTATNLSLTSGTGTDCVSTSTAITPAYQLVANDRVGANAAFHNGLKTLANADNLCVNASAANAHQAEIWYTVQ